MIPLLLIIEVPFLRPPSPSLIEVETDHKCDNIDCMLRGNGVGFIVEF